MVLEARLNTAPRRWHWATSCESDLEDRQDDETLCNPCIIVPLATLPLGYNIHPAFDGYMLTRFPRRFCINYFQSVKA